MSTAIAFIAFGFAATSFGVALRLGWVMRTNERNINRADKFEALASDSEKVLAETLNELEGVKESYGDELRHVRDELRRVRIQLLSGGDSQESGDAILAELDRLLLGIHSDEV